MSTVLAAHGYEVVSTDISDCGDEILGVDFLGQPECSRRMPYYHNQSAIRRGGHSRRAGEVAKAMLDFLRHALALTATVQGQLALLVHLQWIAGKRIAEMMTAAPFAAVSVLTRRIRWFDMGEATNAGQQHHAWVVFDHAHPPGCPPVLLYP